MYQRGDCESVKSHKPCKSRTRPLLILHALPCPFHLERPLLPSHPRRVCKERQIDHFSEKLRHENTSTSCSNKQSPFTRWTRRLSLSLSLSLLPPEPDLLFENTGATFSCSGSTIWAGEGFRELMWIPNWSWCSDLGSLLEKKRWWEEKINSCTEKERNRNVDMEVTRNWGKERIWGSKLKCKTNNKKETTVQSALSSATKHRHKDHHNREQSQQQTNYTTTQQQTTTSEWRQPKRVPNIHPDSHSLAFFSSMNTSVPNIHPALCPSFASFSLSSKCTSVPNIHPTICPFLHPFLYHPSKLQSQTFILLYAPGFILLFFIHKQFGPQIFIPLLSLLFITLFIL